MPSPPRVFISYCHKDEAWKDRLVTQLSVLALDGKLALWEDRQIAAGADWRSEIQQALETVQVAVLLVTADFLTSKFIRRREVPRLLERRRDQGVQIVPVLAGPCAWDRVEWLSAIQCRPADGRSLLEMEAAEVEQALVEISREIDDLLRRSVEGASVEGASVEGLLAEEPLAAPEPQRQHEPENGAPLPLLGAAAAGEDAGPRKLPRSLLAAALGGILLAAGWLSSRSWATPPACTSFAAEPGAVQRGETVTLAWETSKAHSAVVQPDVGSVSVPSDSVQVQPANSMIYTLHLSGRGGASTCEARVEVEEPEPPPPSPPVAVEVAVPPPPPPPSPSPPPKAQVEVQAEPPRPDCKATVIDGESLELRHLFLRQSKLDRAHAECRHFGRPGEVASQRFRELVCDCEPAP